MAPRYRSFQLSGFQNIIFESIPDSHANLITKYFRPYQQDFVGKGEKKVSTWCDVVSLLEVTLAFNCSRVRARIRQDFQIRRTCLIKKRSRIGADVGVEF